MGISHQSIPLQYDTFVDLRPNLDINPTVFSPELIALLNAPLPVEPTPSQIIRPHIERLRVGFFSLRCLANDGAIVAELFDRLLDYTAFCTRTLDVFICLRGGPSCRK
ncbi:hypothetical protein BCR33DRAFT_337367 [Rhizoclosmatium globosum]|uniref:Uncharacterized protein n=1 Tax=Rhizoclosmatium globosum TaxID=329046 RepID=A0A1Y2C3Q7_9FUNG|nr:hypothetical protein BCR33DRAFT_337367 [Rhizoclosmatium globosum]|eukprot:ORY41658.1 hypothetical protein BCR33DRAFT_337367 [Rhizoclosmatium globosum]